PLSITSVLPPATYQWYRNTTNSNTGGTIIDGATNSTYSPTHSVSGSYYFYVVISTTCGNYTSNASGEVIITNTNVWNGGNGSWDLSTNWLGNVVPLTGANIAIPSGTPSLAANTTVGAITIASGAGVNLNGQTFIINGALSGTGTFTASSAAAIQMGAASSGVLNFNGTNNTLGSLTINNSSVSLGSNLTIANTLNIVSGYLEMGANTLTIAGSLSGDGSLRGSSSSNLTITGTGALGTLRMDPTTNETTNVLNNLTINRTSSGSVDLGNNLLIVSGTLTLTQGDFNIGSNTLRLTGPYIAGTVNNLKTTASSQLYLNCTGSGTYTLPAFTNIGVIALNSNSVFNLNSSPTVASSIYLGTGILSIGANTLTMNGDFGGWIGSIRGGTSSNLILTTSNEAGNLVMDQTTPGVTNVLNNLTINKPGKIFSIGRNLIITGT
ncbi:MAG: beta strand repeat-containing protein, partial [Chitinophagaceae bacterium]